MQIPRRYVDRYSRALNVVSERGKAQLSAALMQIDYTADVATVREAISAVMRLHCGASARMAARLAAAFYDGLRLSFGIDDGYKATADPEYDPDATDGAVRAFVQGLVVGKAYEAVVEKCVSRLGYEVNKAANTCTVRNAQADLRKPKYARVPTGAETCHFCLMLASRGFAYLGEASASHAHDNCNCRVVPSWDVDNPLLEGYDHKALYDEWNGAIDQMARERAERNGTTEAAERQKIMDSYKESSKRAKRRKREQR